MFTPVPLATGTLIFPPRSRKDYEQLLQDFKEQLQQEASKLCDDEVLAAELITRVELACYEDYKQMPTLTDFNILLFEKLRFFFEDDLRGRNNATSTLTA